MEVKSAQGGTPKRLYESLSALANRVDGGVLLFGLNESHDFKIVGVGNCDRLQKEIGHLATNEMEPALRPEFTVEEINGQTVVAVEVDEIATTQKPAITSRRGIKRLLYPSGNTNRQMTDYEIFGYVRPTPGRHLMKNRPRGHH